MPDKLLSEDHFISLCMATTGIKIAERRLGKRQYEQQEKYKKSLSMDHNKAIMDAIRPIANYGKMHILNEAIRSKVRGDVSRDNIPNKYQCNTQVYDLVHFLMDLVEGEGRASYFRKEELFVWEKCMSSAINRSGSQLTPGEIRNQLREFEPIKRQLALHTSVELFLEDLNYKRVGEHNRMIKKRTKIFKEAKLYGKKFNSEESFNYKHRDKSAGSVDIDMVVVGELRVFLTEARSYVLTGTHYERMMNYFRTLRKSLFTNRDIHIDEDENKTTISRRLERMLYSVAQKDSNSVGAVAKAARQLAILSLERSNIMGKSTKLYSDAIDMVRCERAKSMLGSCHAFFPSHVVVSNIMGIYKAVPHPDAPLHEMFSSIEGVKSPNSVVEEYADKFEGILRRSLFMSMRTTGHDVRIKSKSRLSNKLQTIVNDITQRTAEAKNFSATDWRDTEFEEVRSIPKIDEMNVPIASKASAAGILMTTTEEQEARAYYAGYGKSVPMKLMRSTTVNDASEAIKGRNGLEIEKAIKRFEKVIKLHERFERKFKGVEIEDIPDKELEKFLEDFPLAEYIVGTEGKFGEYHKVITRLFYIAEQQLKALTQRVERLAKQVSKGQSGVSIVKGYLGRRLDLETSVRGMTGSGDIQRSIAISFDMTEFSKKFPMSLVRKYGKILSEITGEDFLQRIDLFFRASKVMYAKRGFYQHLRGARGGFEGFLNFIWSSIHACIMEVALESTGVRGKLLTFSDDGLLIFYPRSGTKDSEIEDLVIKIQDTYKNLGLEFHLGKTMVSDHMWEYLGDICYNNRLLPAWFKEMIKVSTINISRGYTPLYDKIKVVDSQAKALVTSGGDPVTAYILKRYECSRILRKWIGRRNMLLEEVLLILPTSCGGLRITSPYEDSVYTTITTDSEIYADMVLINEIERGLTMKITSSIMAHMPHPLRKVRDYSRDLKNTTIFKTSLPDTSGGKGLSWLLDRVRESSYYKVPKDPMDKDTCREVFDVLERMETVELDSISVLLSKVPGVSEYQSFIGILKGDGALKLAKRHQIARAQRMDTKSVKSAIEHWARVLRGEVPGGNRFFLDYAYTTAYPTLKLIPMRPSPRIVLERVERGPKASIEIKYAGTGDKNVYEAEYNEPTVKAPANPSTLAWSSEATGDRTLRDEREFLETASRIISSYPESEDSIRGICQIFDLLPPRSISTTPRGLHRTAGTKMRVTDARLILPRFHMATMTARYLGDLSLYLNRYVRADRTSYLEGAKAMSYFPHTSEVMPKSEQSGKNLFYYYSVRKDFFFSCFPTKEMKDGEDTLTIPPETTLGNRLCREYIEAERENDLYIQKIRLMEIASRTDDYMDEEASNILLNGMISLIQNYLISRYTMSSSTILTEDMFPDIAQYRNYILRRAVIRSAISIMDPAIRTDLSRKVNEYNITRQVEPLLESREFGYLAERSYYMYSLIPPEITSMTQPFSMDEFNDHRNEYLNVIVSALYDESVLSDAKIVLFFAKSFKTDQCSNDHRVAYRKIVRETLRSLYAAFASVNWNKRELHRRFPNIANMDVDEQIDCLRVVYDSIRSSTHRGTPYNSKTVIIMLTKFYVLTVDVMRRYRRIGAGGRMSKNQLFHAFRDWVPNLLQQATILGSVAMPGEDHRANVTRIFSNGIVRRAVNNAMRYVNTNSVPRTISRNMRVEVQEVRNMQTAFNETLMYRAERKLKPYHYNVGKFVSQEFIRLTRNYTPVACIESSIDAIVGEDEYDRLAEEETCELLFNHLEILKNELGFLGFKTHPSLDGHLYDMVRMRYGCEEMVNASSVGRLGSDSNFKAFDIRCESVSKALATYIHLCREVMSSASIIKERREVPFVQHEDVIVEEDEEEISEASSLEEEEGGVEEFEEEDSFDPEDYEEYDYSDSGSERDESEESSRQSSEEEQDEDEEEEGEEPGYDVERRVRWGDEEDAGGEAEVLEEVIEYEEDEDAYESSEEGSEERGDVMPHIDEEYQYRVVGITSKEGLYRLPDSNPEVRSDFTDTLGELVDNLSVTHSIKETDSIISSLTSSSSAFREFTPTPYTVIQQSNLLTPGRQVNRNSATLQAASELAKEYQEGGYIIASYVYLVAFFMNIKEKEEIRRLFTDVTRRYNEDKANMTLEIARANSWLKVSDITMGTAVTIRQVSKLKMYALKVMRNSRANIPSNITTQHFRSFENAFEIARAEGEAGIGNISNYLYILDDEDEVLEIDLDAGDDELDFDSIGSF